MTEFKCRTWFLGISEVAKVAEKGTGIQNGSETYQ